MRGATRAAGTEGEGPDGSAPRLAHVDPLAAYVATSPGGLDSVAIIAASTFQVYLFFVLAFQSVRLLSVIVLTPPITRHKVQWLLVRA